MKDVRSILVALATCLLLPIGVAAQDTGSVIGTVVAEETGEPLPGVAVGVVGTNRHALTDTEGVYRIARVPSGEQEINAIRLGYAAISQTVMVPEGGMVTADFVLETSALALEGIVVNAAGVDQREREVGNAVSQIQLDDIELSSVGSVPEVLLGRAPGVTVGQTSGTSGTGARIRIRGSNSISLSNEPLVIIDGVRANTANDAGDYFAGQSTSRFNDLNADDIENIEVLKGPAASALYGTAAANGVIQITTKQGTAGQTRFSAYTEQGTIIEDNTYPANFSQRGVTLVPTGLGPPGQEFVGCTIPLQSGGICDPVETISFNPLETNSPFQDGRLQTYGFSVSGGEEQVRFFVSGEKTDEEGVYKINLVDQVNLRANMRANLREDLDLSIKTGYISNDARLPYNDNAVEGIVSSGLLGYSTPGETGGYYGYPLENRFEFQNEQGVERFIGSVQSAFHPMPWLSFNAMAGLDLFTTTALQTLRPNIFPESLDRDYAIGYRFATRDVNRGVNANLSATAELDVTEDIFSTTIVGGQYIRDALESTGGGGYGLLPGTESLNALAERFEVFETNLEEVTVGGYVSQQFSWQDRIFVTGALRGDDNSAFGNDFGLVLYPSVSASWVMDEEAWFPDGEVLTDLRLRAAYGESGLQPGFRTARQYFSPVSATLSGDVSVPAVTIGGAGNPDLEPEQSREYELGFDAGFLNDRLGLEFTYYDKKSSQALVSRPLPPSLGSASSQTINIGSVSNRGLETQLTARLLEMDDVRWTANLSLSTNDNEVERLGEDVTGEPLPPIIFGLGGNTQRIQEGFPLGAYFARPILGFEDQNGDGLIGPEEIDVGADPVYMGTPFPTRELSFYTNVRLFELVELSALIDYKGGHKLYHATEEFRCAVFASCRSINDPNTPLDDQARAVATRELATVAGYFEDADFAKLRSVSLRITAPRRYAEMAGVEDMSLTISARNLHTWTDYSGLDPEINSAGPANFSTYDFLGQPPVEHYTMRFEVVF